ncbi:MAG: mannose-1-phosphate guanylyltransferase [Bacteroidales bacterium]|nr:mannose-1-phosphate guanylyltransferase [Bacteroidales bacterium]
MAENQYCIIMAGGLGSRFWPVSRNSKPKQFLDILGTGKTFIRQTYERFEKIMPRENILVVTSLLYKDMVTEQIPELTADQILLEPYRRNTAPCMAYASYKILTKDPDATVVVTPSDHLIQNEEVFLETIENALRYAQKNDVLITLGVEPNRPETEYGYIQANKHNFFNINGNVAYTVKTFTEKPNAQLAEVFVNSGEFLWNSGIFIWNLKTILKEIEAHQPEIATIFGEGTGKYYTAQEPQFINKVYEECKSISIDYGIMENTDKAVVYPVSFGWSDLGTWESLYSQFEGKSGDNLVQAKETLLRGVSNSIIVSEGEKKLIVAAGLDNFMIINTNDVLLICPRDESVYKSIMTDLPLIDLSKYQ